MAKIKTNTEETKQAPVTNEAVEEVKKEVEAIVKEEEMDDNVKAILQCFKEHETLYVNDMGGVFTADTDKSLLGNAVLYHNPYYKH